MATTCKLIAKVSLGSDAANIEFTDIPGTYTDLYLVASLRSDRSSMADIVKARLNGATSDTSHSSRELTGNGSAAGSSAYSAAYPLYCAGNTATSNTFGNGEIYFPNYAGSTNKSFSGTSVQETNGSESYIQASACLWSSTAAITAIKLLPTYGSNLKSGSTAYLYGITKA